MGVPLFRMKEIRVLYGEDPWGDSHIDFDTPVNVPEPRGHVIAARITSENPDEVGRRAFELRSKISCACRLRPRPQLPCENVFTLLKRR